jgi:hypothetical protein
MKRVLGTVRVLTAVGALGTLLVTAGPAIAQPYIDGLTGEECVPDPNTLPPLHGHNGQGQGNGGHNSPTGIPGDNVDDPQSGKVDCLGDGDSGRGNDLRCCDANGCCPS